MGSEEAGAGNRTVSPGGVSGWIRSKCIVKLPHKGHVHTQRNNSELPPTRTQRLCQIQTMGKMAIYILKCLPPKMKCKITNNSTIPDANEERDSNRA